MSSKPTEPPRFFEVVNDDTEKIAECKEMGIDWCKKIQVDFDILESNDEVTFFSGVTMEKLPEVDAGMEHFTGFPFEVPRQSCFSPIRPDITYW